MLYAAYTNAKTLIVYYSFTNNTHAIATDLQSQTGADMLRIEPAEEGLDYAADNYAIGSAMIQTIRNNPDDAASYPAIKPVSIDISGYDTIIIGAPLWWSDMAAPLQAFLFRYGSEMAGKAIGLIVSSASSGISGVEADAKRLIPDGRFITPSLWIRSSQTSECHSIIENWLGAIGYEGLTSSIIASENDTAGRIVASDGKLTVNGHAERLCLYGTSGAKISEAAGNQIYTGNLIHGTYIVEITKGDQRTSRKVYLTD